MTSAAIRTAASAAEAVASRALAGRHHPGRAVLGVLAAGLSASACLSVPGPAAPVDAAPALDAASCTTSSLFAAGFEASLDPGVWYWCEACEGGASVAVDPRGGVLTMELPGADALAFAGTRDSFPLASRLRVAVREVAAIGANVAKLNVGWSEELIISVSREGEGELVVRREPEGVELWSGPPAPHRALEVDGAVVTLEQSDDGIDWTRDVIVGALEGDASTASAVGVQLLAIADDAGSVSFDDFSVAACEP